MLFELVELPPPFGLGYLEGEVYGEPDQVV